jgi:hypothetical protein
MKETAAGPSCTTGAGSDLAALAALLGHVPYATVASYPAEGHGPGDVRRKEQVNGVMVSMRTAGRRASSSLTTRCRRRPGAGYRTGRVVTSERLAATDDAAIRWLRR